MPRQLFRGRPMLFTPEKRAPCIYGRLGLLSNLTDHITNRLLDSLSLDPGSFPADWSIVVRSSRDHTHDPRSVDLRDIYKAERACDQWGILHR